MLLTMYSAGLRRSELCKLKVSNIDSGRMVIRIERGKGGVDREVPLNPKLLTTLREYWRWMRPKTYLFPGTSNGWRADKPITPKVIWEAVQAGRTEGWNPETRHTTYSPALLCHAHARRGSGPANHSGPDGPQGHRSDDSLSACVPEAFAGSYQSAGADSCLRPSTLAALAEVTQAGMSRPTVEVADLLRTQGDRFVAREPLLAQLSAVESVARHSALPHASFGRPSRSVFRVRSFGHLV